MNINKRNLFLMVLTILGVFTITSCTSSEEGGEIIIDIGGEQSACIDGAQLLFDEGFESGTFDLKVDGNDPVVVQLENAPEGNFVMKSQLSSETNDTYRTEASLNIDELYFEPGKEYWVGLSTKIGEDFPLMSSFNDQGMLLQWHYKSWLRPEVQDAQPLVVRYNNGFVRLHCEMVPNDLALVPATIGEWVDWVIHVKFDNSDGIFQIWWNGTKVADWTGDNHIIEMIEGAYMKFGLYSAQYKEGGAVGPLPQGQTRTVYHDQVRIAGSDGCYDLVAPK